MAEITRTDSSSVTVQFSDGAARITWEELWGKHWAKTGWKGYPLVCAHGHSHDEYCYDDGCKTDSCCQRDDCPGQKWNTPEQKEARSATNCAIEDMADWMAEELAEALCAT